MTTPRTKPVVVHLTTVHPHDDNRILYKECVSLADAGYDVCLVARRMGRGAVPEGVKLVRLSERKGLLGRGWTSTVEAFRAVRKIQPAVLHFHDPELIFVGVVFALMGTRVIYDVHEDITSTIRYKEYIPASLRPPLAWIARQVEHAAAKVISAVVAATPPISGMFAGVTKECRVVQNFPRQEEIEAFGERAAAGVTSQSQAALYVGSITKPRGIIEMLDSMLHVAPGVKFVLAGRIDPTSLAPELQSHPGWARVDYRGVLTRPEVIETMSQGGIGLILFHPEQNYLDCYPTKLFEYMAAGLPVVVSDFPLWRSIVEDAKCGLMVDPSDPVAIARSIDELLSNDTLARQLGESGRAAVRQKYTWRTEGEKLVGLYSELLGHES